MYLIWVICSMNEWELKELDLSKFNTNNVTDMS